MLVTTVRQSNLNAVALVSTRGNIQYGMSSFWDFTFHIVNSKVKKFICRKFHEMNGKELVEFLITIFFTFAKKNYFKVIKQTKFGFFLTTFLFHVE